jgi:tetratricopeptide (TPR) repeat protein
MHLIGNMYLLWLCGCTLEDVWGRPLYIAFYVASGAIAAICHAWAFPDSNAHLVGASGAIAGLMGAFLIRFYATRIRFFYWYWIHFGTFLAPAWVMLPLWLLTQVFEALLYGETTPIAFTAHIGGFFFGATIAIFLKFTLVEEAFLAPAIDEKTNLFSQHREVEQALKLIEAGRHQESVRHLLTALRDEPNDVDALHVLAQSYTATSRPADAAKAWQRKLKIHLKRRETDLAAQTYFEMKEANHDIQLPPRESLSIAAALVQGAHLQDAIALYQQVITSSAEPVFKLKASIALADLYIKDFKGHLALDVLQSVTPLAESLPDWKLHLQQKMESVRS